MIVMALIPEEKPPPPVVKKAPFYSLDKIEAMVKDKKTDEPKMKIIISSLIEHHHLPPKERGKPTKEAKHILEMIFTLSGHSQMNNDMRNEMFEELIAINPEYEREFKNAS